MTQLQPLSLYMYILLQMRIGVTRDGQLGVFYAIVTTLRSHYVVAIPSVVCLSSVTFTHPTEKVGFLAIFFATSNCL